MSTPEGGWIAGPDRTRDPEIKRGPRSKLIIKVAKMVTRGKSFNFLRVLTIDGRLAIPYLLWNARLMPRGKLDRKLTEAVIIRTAWLCRSEYEWTQHCAIGRSVGLSAEQIAAAGPQPASDLFAEPLSTLLLAVEELLTEHRLSDQSYEQLRGQLPPARIQEYVMLVGTYAALAGSLNTFGAPLEGAWQRGS